MPRTKKAAPAAAPEKEAPAKAATKKDETAEMAAAAKAAAKTAKAAKTAETAAEKPAEAVAEKKAPAKKAPAKKAAPKKVAPKKPEAKAEAKVNFYVEFNGHQESVEEVIKNVKATYGKDAKEIAIYLKPQESKAYFVADGESKEMDVYFC